MKELKLKISARNDKMGEVASVSLLPIQTCPTEFPCRTGCYAIRMLSFRPNIGTSWQRNTELWRLNPVRYWTKVRTYIETKMPALFRFHVAGDIPNQDYLEEMKRTARQYRGVRFLCFTKRHELDFRHRPRNLAIMASMWPGWGNVELVRGKRLPIAWMQDGTETRIPIHAIHCNGQCDACGICWVRRTDVVFKKH